MSTSTTTTKAEPKRRAITEGEGKWFDVNKARAFGEETYWNGNNHISKATGSQWSHECLYRTAGGRWVLNSWSNCDGGDETYSLISEKAAAAWLVQNEWYDVDGLQALIDSLEV